MSLPRYLEYKPSGVEWLGEVPGHWASIRYKNVFVEKSSIAGASLPPGSISFGRVIFKDDEFLHEPTKASYQEILSGEFLINPINLNYDLKSLRTALSEIDTCVSPAYIVLKIKVASDKNYLKYQLHLFDLFHMKTLGAGVRQTITFGDIGGCFTRLPPVPEQTQIAAFLDRETGKIDALIAEQRRLVDLLAEKRQAVISHAVTKGLNPNTKMKDSGIEWLGEVPKHWSVCALGYLATIQTGSTPDRSKPDYWEGEIPWLKTGEINYELILDSEEKITEAGLQNSAAKIAEVGTLMMAMYGQGITRGRVAILGIRAAYNQACAAITPGSKLFNEYAKYFFVMAYRFIRDTGNETSQMNLGSGVIAKIKILTPPIEEQRAIAAFLDTETAKFDTLTAEANRVIALLQERRNALISAAVTGKIDVRQAS